MSDFRDWQITLPFDVPTRDFEGTFTEAVFEAALQHAPAAAAGLTARADTAIGKVWIVFTLLDTSEDLARDIAVEMHARVAEGVVSAADDVCIIAG